MSAEVKVVERESHGPGEWKVAGAGAGAADDSGGRPRPGALARACAYLTADEQKAVLAILALALLGMAARVWHTSRGPGVPEKGVGNDSACLRDDGGNR